MTEDQLIEINVIGYRPNGIIMQIVIMIIFWMQWKTERKNIINERLWKYCHLK